MSPAVINAKTETLIRLAEVPAILPLSQITGRRYSRQAIWKWTTAGVGGVKLETITVTLTSREAVERFLGDRVVLVDPDLDLEPDLQEDHAVAP